MTDLERIRAMTDDDLATTAARLRKRADLQSALGMADIHVARFEPASDAVDRQLDRNLMAASRISHLQQMVRDELARRAA